MSTRILYIFEKEKQKKVGQKRKLWPVGLGLHYGILDCLEIFWFSGKK